MAYKSTFVFGVVAPIFILTSLNASTKVQKTEDVFNNAKLAADSGEYKRAIRIIDENQKPDWNVRDLAMASLVSGIYQFKNGDLQDAKLRLNKSLELSPKNSAHVAYYLAQVMHTLGDSDEAIKLLDRASKTQVSRLFRYQIKYLMGQMAFQTKRYALARDQFNYLERKWRRTPDHPVVLYDLMAVEFASDRRWIGCRAARKLYSLYPEYAKIDSWGIYLKLAMYNGKPIHCEASTAEAKTRIDRWRRAGQIFRARKEISDLRKMLGPDMYYYNDQILVDFLASEGDVEEALEIHLRYYKEMKDNFNYQMLLGKAAARAGEYKTAIGAYHEAYKLNPRSSSGRQALFHSAFLSYQSQDYDGASRKFEEIIQKYARSGLSRDSFWHLGWIRYLRGDYVGAIDKFQTILQQKESRSTARLWRSFPTDRVLYWTAMAYLKIDQKEKAIATFKEISSSQTADYYKYIAETRLKQLGVKEIDSPIASATNDLINELMRSPSGEVDAEGEAVVAEEDESEETIANAPTGGADSVVADEAPELDKEEKLEITMLGLKSSRFTEHLERANDFIRAGLYEWAKLELFAVEQVTSNKTHLKALMQAYAKIGAYHRVLQIGEWGFLANRLKLGMVDGKDLWEAAYPQAFEQYVTRYAQQSSVPKEFVWSIMRQESQFRVDALSPVGARGLMQIMPNTGQQLAKLSGQSDYLDDRLFDPVINIRLGTQYLKRLLSKFKEQVPMAAAAYNAGPHRVDTWIHLFGNLDMDEFIEHIPFLETRNYVKKVVRNMVVYQRLYKGSGWQMDSLAQPVPMRITHRPSAKESWD